MTFVLLPGLGADARSFEAQRRELEDVVVPDWIEPLPREPLADYATRLADTITVGDEPFVLGGVSFGGIVALELATRFPRANIALIASCPRPADFTRLVRAARILAPLTPTAMLKTRVGAWLAETQFGLRTGAERKLFHGMLRGASKRFLSWALRTAASWQGARLGERRIHRICGDQDRIIRADGCDVVVRGAGHFVNVTHAAEVNAFLRNVADGGF